MMREKRNKFVIDRNKFIELVYCEIQDIKNTPYRTNLYPKDVLRLNIESLKAIWRIAERVIEYHLTELDCDEDDVIVVKPFRGITIWAYEEDEKQSVNNLTGESYIRPARRRFRAFIDRYTRYVWNKIR